jgi:hypothetical protein
MNNNQELTCKTQLIEWLLSDDVHSVLQVSFYDIFKLVWNRIMTSPNKKELINILNTEMKDADCKCFTGRITRLINVLVGYYDDIHIRISDSEQISNIISQIQNKYIDDDDIKKNVIKELEERGYSKKIIDEWIIHL